MFGRLISTFAEPDMLGQLRPSTFVFYEVIYDLNGGGSERTVRLSKTGKRHLSHEDGIIEELGGLINIQLWLSTDSTLEVEDR